MQKIDQACVNTLRFLAADQVEKAKSGHPGFPLGTAPLMYTIWDRFMNYNPADRNGSTATVSSFLRVTAALCFMLCCIWQAMTCPWMS